MSRSRVFRAAALLYPVVEVLAVIGVGKLVGVWWTLGLLLAGGAAGALLVAAGGRRAFGSLRRTLSTGETPDRRLANSVLTVAGGLLLLVPGFVTDVLGLIFVLPPTRRLARRALGLVAVRSAGRVMLDVRAGAASPGVTPVVVPSEVIRSHDTPG